MTAGHEVRVEPGRARETSFRSYAVRFVLGELLIRFIVGGLIVTAFALVGDVPKPKTFAVVFGGPPSAALAAAALPFLHAGPAYVG